MSGTTIIAQISMSLSLIPIVSVCLGSVYYRHAVVITFVYYCTLCFLLM